VASVTFDGVTKVYPNGHVGIRELDLVIDDGEMLVLVGPSGCGKSTALRMVAGLETITEGELRIGEEVVNDLPPKERDIAMVFQNYALYPHMTVAQNIGFALKLAGRPKAEIAERVAEAAQTLQLEPWLNRKPGQLSGGQRQRVAMGRAIVREPAVFLMDEPLSNLDAKLRVQVRTQIARLQRDLKTTTVYVTHDQVEAMTMGDRVAVLRDGVLQQIAPPETLYGQPDNMFVAAFIGSPAMNLLEGRLLRADGGGLAVQLGSQTLDLGPALLGARPALAEFVDRDVVVGIRPEQMEDSTLEQRSDEHVALLTADVELREALGSELLVHLRIDAKPAITDDIRHATADVDDAAVEALEQQVAAGEAKVVSRFDTRSRVKVDDRIDVRVSTAHLHWFDPATGAAIRDHQ